MAASQVFEIPLRATPQLLVVSLGGTLFQLRLVWCDPNGAWTLDLADVNGNPILQGLPLVTGLDLLGQYRYLGIPGKLVAQTDHDTLAVPTRQNLGTTGHLYFLPS